jgi:hypothetical protein
MGTTRSFFQSRIGSADIFVEMLSLNPESGLMASSGSKVQHKHFRTDLPFVYSHRAAAHQFNYASHRFHKIVYATLSLAV